MSRTNQELLDYSGEHIAYELQMFLFGWRFNGTAWGTWPPPLKGLALQPGAQSWLILMSLKDALVLHARVLTMFLYPGQTHTDDAMATEYAPDWRTIRPPMDPLLKDLRDRAGAELAHLTWKRKAGATPDKAWQPETFIAIMRSFTLFAEHAENLHENVLELVEEHRFLLD